MADSGNENTARAEGAEGGNSSDEVEYELYAEEEDIETAWESAEVHPRREYPRLAYNRSGRHPPELPPRVYLTNRPTSASPSRQRGVQTDEPPQDLQQERQLQEQGGQAVAAAVPEHPQPEQGRQAAAAVPEHPQREQGGQVAVAGQEQQENVSLRRRISGRLKAMRLRGSRDESPRDH